MPSKVLIPNLLSKKAKGYSMEYPKIHSTISQHSLPQGVDLIEYTLCVLG